MLRVSLNDFLVEGDSRIDVVSEGVHQLAKTEVSWHAIMVKFQSVFEVFRRFLVLSLLRQERSQGNARREVLLVEDKAFFEESNGFLDVFHLLTQHTVVEVGVHIGAIRHINSFLISFHCHLILILLLIHSGQTHNSINILRLNLQSSLKISNRFLKIGILTFPHENI